MKSTFAVAAILATLAAAGAVEAPEKHSVSKTVSKTDAKLDYGHKSLDDGALAYNGYDDFYGDAEVDLGYGSSLRSDVGANIRPDRLDKLGGDNYSYGVGYNGAGYGYGKQSYVAPVYGKVGYEVEEKKEEKPAPQYNYRW